MIIKVAKITDGVRITINEQNLWINQPTARQLIADIMAALDEPIKPDVTTQAYQEFPSIRDQHMTFSAEKIAFENDLQKFVGLYVEAQRRGFIK